MRMDLDPQARNKLLAAAIAVGLTLLGLTSGIRWLTVVALAFWIVALMLLGSGRRKTPVSVTEEDG